jgi:hypothetical protein
MFLIIVVYTTVRMIPLKNACVFIWNVCSLKLYIFVSLYVSSLPVCNHKIGRGKYKGV